MADGSSDKTYDKRKPRSVPELVQSFGVIGQVFFK